MYTLKKKGLNMCQPLVNGIEEIGNKFAGKVSFFTCCDIQKTLVAGSNEDIVNEALELMKWWGTEKGGFICKDYGESAAIGCSPDKKKVMYDAFITQDLWRQSQE